MNRTEFLKQFSSFIWIPKGEKKPTYNNWNKEPLVLSAALKTEQNPGKDVGILVTDDFFVVDLDKKELLKGFKEQYNLKIKPTIATARGYHFYFKGIIPTVSNLGDKIDVLKKGRYANFSEEKEIISGQIYDISDFPELKGSLTPARKPSKNHKTGNFPLSEVKVALSYIKPEDCSFDDWTRIGMALQSEFGDSAFDHYLHWSQLPGWKKVDSVEKITEKWNGFKGEGITIATFIKLAQQGGYKLSDNKWEDHPVWKEYSLVNDENKFYHNESRCPVSDKAFHIRIGQRLKRDGVKKRPTISTVISEGLVPFNILKTRIYDPRSRDAIVGDCFNKFSYASMGEISDSYTKEGLNAIKLIKEHIVFLCKGDMDKAMIIFNFLAHIRQKPWNKHLWCLYLVGGQGIGKSGVLGRLSMILLGDENVGKIKDTQVESGFNDWHTDRLLNILPEIKISGKNRKELYDCLKEEIGDLDSGVQRKYKDHQGLVMSFCNYIICSNHDNAILLESDDRRFCVIDGPKEKKPKEEMEKLWNEALLNKTAYPDIRRYFEKDVKLTDKYPKESPHTEDKITMYKSILEEAEGYEELQEAIHDSHETHINEDYIKTDDWKEYLEQKYQYSDVYNLFVRGKTNSVRNAYIKLGYPHTFRKLITNKTIIFKTKIEMDSVKFNLLYEKYQRK